MSKSDFLDKYSRLAQTVAGLFPAIDHERVFRAAVEHNMTEEDIRIASNEYFSRPGSERRFVLNAIAEAGVKSAPSLSDSVDIRVILHRHQTRTQERVESYGLQNDDEVSEIAENLLVALDVVSYFAQKVTLGERDKAPADLRQLIIEFRKALVELDVATEIG